MQNDDLKKERYDLLVEEMTSSFPKLMTALEEGARVIIVSDETEMLASDLTPDKLALLGGAVRVCQAHSATLVYMPTKGAALTIVRL